MLPERLAILRKHHKLGCHAVATMADVDGLLAEIEDLKARLLPPSAVVMTPTEWNDMLEEHDAKLTEIRTENEQLRARIAELETRATVETAGADICSLSL